VYFPANLREGRNLLVNRRWETVRPLGEGGMGRVHLARDRHQGGREVALKILRHGRLEPEAAARFRDEFASLARLRHPNLAEVYDYGLIEGDGVPFLTLEVIDGRDLATLPRAEARAACETIAAQCLRALDFIHTRGWRHNDIKPQNIMLTAARQVKLLDFGLARPIAGGGARDGPSGTLHYLAPELLAGGAGDGRSDLYAMGVVLYELLTGKKPFDATRPGEVITAALAGEAPAPRAIDPSIDVRLDAFVRALMARAPGDRPADAAAALARLNDGAPSPWPLDTPETFAAWLGSGPLAGRDDARMRLRTAAARHLADAGARASGVAEEGGSGATRLLIIAGPAGSGKTRLTREIRQDLQLSGAATLEGRCDPTGADPLQPFSAILRAARAGKRLDARRRAALARAAARPRRCARRSRTPGRAPRHRRAERC